MNPAWISLIINVAAHSPELGAQLAGLYADTAHGEGGRVKVAKIFSDLGALFGTAAGVATPAAG